MNVGFRDALPSVDSDDSDNSDNLIKVRTTSSKDRAWDSAKSTLLKG